MGRSDLALIWASSGPEQMALFLGAWRVGVVLVPLDQRLTPEIVSRIADRAGTKWLVTGDGPEMGLAASGSFRRLRGLPLTFLRPSLRLFH